MGQKSEYTDQFINSSLDPITLVQSTFLLCPPKVIPQYIINLFGKIHPLVLGFRHALLVMQLSNETRVSGDTGRDGSAHEPELIHSDLKIKCAVVTDMNM